MLEPTIEPVQAYWGAGVGGGDTGVGGASGTGVLVGGGGGGGFLVGAGGTSVGVGGTSVGVGTGVLVTVAVGVLVGTGV